MGGSGGSCKILVVSEMALALVLMIGAALAVNSFARLLQRRAGIRRARCADSKRAAARATLRDDGADRAFLRRGARTAGRRAGRGKRWRWRIICRSAAPTASRLVTVGRAGANQSPWTSAWSARITFARLASRSSAVARLRQATAATAPGVAVVDESFARTVWPNEDPLGRRLRFGDENSSNPWLTVVGVARDTKGGGLGAACDTRRLCPVHTARRHFERAQRWTADAAPRARG